MKKAKTTTNHMKGYKVTDKNMQCKSYQYELGKLHKHIGNIESLYSGFHFCIRLKDCFNHYSFNSENRVFEVDGSGVLVKNGDTYACSKIKLIRELSWIEVLSIVNTGKNNTGRENSGDNNSGNSNKGDWNSGIDNSGKFNSGNYNSNNFNSGNWNSGKRNSGNFNSGTFNSGDWNSGHSNSGNWNNGNRNGGNGNSGNRNGGNWNTGDRNSGDSNIGYGNSGAFCINNDPKIFLFNKESEITVKEWEKTRAFTIMKVGLYPNIWVQVSDMTDKEKEEYPFYEATGGYLKSISLKEAWAIMWHDLHDKQKKEFTSLPNFDTEIFKEITGIDINKKEEVK